MGSVSLEYSHHPLGQDCSRMCKITGGFLSGEWVALVVVRLGSTEGEGLVMESTNIRGEPQRPYIIETMHSYTLPM